MKKGVLLPISELIHLDLDIPIVRKREVKEVIEYANIPASYDIETSSFRDDYGAPVAITYSHCINIDGYCFIAREWDEFKRALQDWCMINGFGRDRRLIVYVHYLNYEFQFIKKHFNFTKILANGGDRKILSALTTDGIEFRCSQMLSGLSLRNVAKNLTKYKIRKLDGDLDHTIIHTPETPLTDEELGYILNDVLIVEYFIREAMDEADGNISKIPLTNTGYVRNYVRNKTIRGSKKENRAYRKLMQELTLDIDEYRYLRQAFAGGFTHANIRYVGKVLYNITARDFASSYPARMIAYQYPMSKGELYDVKDKDDFFHQIYNYCCLFYVTFDGLTTKANESYISLSKCLETSNVKVNNGRVYSAEHIGLWMTDVDFQCVMMSYDVDDFNVYILYRYRRGYLPTPFIESILKLYEDKTMLKGIDDMKAEYQRAKGMLNSTYGMSVMDVGRDTFAWNPNTKSVEKVETELSEVLDKENNSKKRFLFYPWGVWITAYARYDLFREIIALGDDYVYADTDSIYCLNGDKNKHIFDKSNKRILGLLERACKVHGIDPLRLSPKDKKGKRRTIGLWNLDGEYTRFKTLGAKRYMVEFINDDNEKEVKITVSGVNKTLAVPYLIETYGYDNIFDVFDKNLHIPEGKCGKSTHTYIDEEAKGIVRDYRGVPYEYHELSFIHLEETFYSMKISNEFREMIEYVQGARLQKVI